MDKKVVVCAIAKYEYEYIKEWVEYNLSIGFDKIVIYDNNDPEGESYDELLSDYINEGKVEIRDVRGMTSMQRVVYKDFYDEGDFDWCAFIDIDEFITLNKYDNIKDFVDVNENADAYFLFWQTYGDGGRLYKDPNKSILENYDKPCDFYALIDNAVAFQNRWGKSIIKKGLPVKGMHEHFVYSCYGDYTINYCNSRGEETYIYNYNISKGRELDIRDTYDYAYIKHIYTKSIKDYIDHKVKRRAANSNNVLHSIDKFFTINDVTQEKVDLLKDLGYKLNFVFKPDTIVMLELVNSEQYRKLMPYLDNIKRNCNTRVFIKLQEYDNDIDLGELGDQNEFYYYSHLLGDDISELNKLFFQYSNYLIHSKALIHIGVSRETNFDDEFIQTYIEPLFGDKLHDNLKFVLEQPTKSIITIDSNYINSNDFYNVNSGYKESVENVSNNLGIELPYMNLKNNIFIAKTEVLKPYCYNDFMKFSLPYGDQYTIKDGVWCSSDYHVFKQIFYGLFDEYYYVS